MKKLFLFFVLISAARAASLTLTWDYPAADLSPDVEFAIEEKSGTTIASYKEVAKSSGQSVTFDAIPYGVHTYRVRARSIANPSIVSDYSNEATGTVKMSSPSGAKVTVTVTVSSTAGK